MPNKITYAVLAPLQTLPPKHACVNPIYLNLRGSAVNSNISNFRGNFLSWFTRFKLQLQIHRSRLHWQSCCRFHRLINCEFWQLRWSSVLGGSDSKMPVRGTPELVPYWLLYYWFAENIDNFGCKWWLISYTWNLNNLGSEVVQTSANVPRI
jgi:hypothetical protein